MELALSKQDADKLISLLKDFLKDYSFQLQDGSNFKIDIISQKEKRKFRLDIHYEHNNYHLNFMDCITKLNLIRINLNDSFHKNADGTKIRGNRVNLFCEDEFNCRQDGQYMRAYKLPYNQILKNPQSFSDALEEMLDYINITNNKKHKLEINSTLF